MVYLHRWKQRRGRRSIGNASFTTPAARAERVAALAVSFTTIVTTTCYPSAYAATAAATATAAAAAATVTVAPATVASAASATAVAAPTFVAAIAANATGSGATVGATTTIHEECATRATHPTAAAG